MIKTISVNIGNSLFNINEDAYQALENYFHAIKFRYNFSAEGKEILRDIENRVAELWREKSATQKIIVMADVTYVISVIGKAENFGASTQSAGYSRHENTRRTSRRLYRDTDNKAIGGVCAGLAAYFDMDPVIVRVIFVLLFFFGFGPIFYIVLWIVVPKARTLEQKNEMFGYASY